MAADEATVLKRATEILNACAAGTFSATIDSGYADRNATAISEASRESAMLLARAMLVDPNHVHRNIWISGTPTSLTHAAELPDMAGEGDLVEIQPYSGGAFRTGVLRDVQQIEDFRLNPSSIYSDVAYNVMDSPLGGYYAFARGRFYFTGYAAQGYFPAISRSSVTSLIPDEYEGTWVCLVVGLSVKEGDNLFPEAQYYMNLGLSDLKAISQMGVIEKLPPMQRAQEARGNA